MIIKLTLNELKQLAFEALNLDCMYKHDSDLLVSPHKIEVIDAQSKLEEGSG